MTDEPRHSASRNQRVSGTHRVPAHDPEDYLQDDENTHWSPSANRISEMRHLTGAVAGAGHNTTTTSSVSYVDLPSPGRNRVRMLSGSSGEDAEIDVLKFDGEVDK